MSEQSGEASKKSNEPEGIEGKLSDTEGSELNKPKNHHMGGPEDIPNDGDDPEDDNKAVEIDELVGHMHGLTFSDDGPRVVRGLETATDNFLGLRWATKRGHAQGNLAELEPEVVFLPVPPPLGIRSSFSDSLATADR